MASKDSATSGAFQTPVQMTYNVRAKSGPPRVIEIDPENPFVMDRARIYATLNGLRRHDIQDCTTVDLNHTADLLARLVALDELSTEPVGAMLDRLIHEFNMSQVISQFMKQRHAHAVSRGAAQEFTEAMVAAHTEGGEGLDIALVRLHQKEQGCTEHASIRAVAQLLARGEMDADPEAVERRYEALKKKINRSKKHKS